VFARILFRVVVVVVMVMVMVVVVVVGEVLVVVRFQRCHISQLILE
jgi:hypothetical protein